MSNDTSSPPDVAICIFAPTPLLTVTLEEGTREPQMHVHLGGQGAWIARMVRTLGARPRYCGAFGGETGHVARLLCDGESFDVHAVETAGWNGSYVHDRRSGKRVELAAAPATALTRHELDDLYSMTLGVALDSDACVIAGAHYPDVVPDDLFSRLARDLGRQSLPIVGDLSGESLNAVLNAEPTMLKVSDEELERGGWARSRDRSEVLGAMTRLADAGARDIVVSRGSEPTISLWDGRLYEVHVPQVEVVDPSGGGDSMTAALAVALARGLPAEDSLCLAAAAAVATVTRHGLGTGHADLIAATARLVDVVAVE